jgi:hypothetical protein
MSVTVGSGAPALLWQGSLLVVLAAYALCRVADAWRRLYGRTTLRPFGRWPILPLLVCQTGLIGAVVLLALAYDGLTGLFGVNFWADTPHERMMLIRVILILVAVVMLGGVTMAFLSRIVIDVRGAECLPRWFFRRRRSFLWEEVVAWEVAFAAVTADRQRVLQVRLTDGKTVRFSPQDCLNRLDELIDAFRAHVPDRLTEAIRLRMAAAGRGGAGTDERIREGPSDHVR